MLGVSSQPTQIIQQFAQENGLTFPMLRDTEGVYNDYYIPGGQSPFPRDFIIDQQGIVRLANNEFDADAMVFTIQQLMQEFKSELEIQTAGNEVQLYWSQIPGVTAYRLWRSEDPRFQTGAEELIYEGITNIYSDQVSGSAFYRVVGVFTD